MATILTRSGTDANKPSNANAAELLLATDTHRLYHGNASGAPYEICPTSIIMPKTLSTDHTSVGMKCIQTAGEALVFGDICCGNNSGKWVKADADAWSTAGGMLLMADASISSDADGVFLITGIARDDTSNWTLNAPLFLSTTPGVLTETAPSGTDDVIKIVAQATNNADTILFRGIQGGIEHT